MNNKAHAGAQMMIRKNIAEVFNAFIDPVITSNFWFTKGSGKLEVDKEVIWEWEMYNVSAKVVTREIIPDEKIVFEWGDDNEWTEVEMGFLNFGPEATYVTIVHSGFDEEGDGLIAAIRDSTGGFTMVLAGLKAYMEHGIHLNLIGDKFPEEMR